jgi:DNA-binding GntR family transcriptional regulator
MGRLSPGHRLRLEQLTEGYHASVSTLREALSRLISEKLVIAEGQRGFHVAPVSIEDLQEIAALRLLLEKHALAQSFENGDLEWEASVVAAHHKLATLEERRKADRFAEPETWKRYDWQFHQTLISACGSRTLIQTHAVVFDKYLRYQMLALSDRGEIAVREHRALLDCALARDAGNAIDILDAHIGGGVTHALAAGVLKPAP